MRLGPLRLVRKYGQTSREFVELEGELGRIEGLGATTALHERLAARLRARMAVLVDIRLCLDLHLKNEQLVRSTAGLLVFLVRWMGTLSSKTLRALPEFFFEAALEWVLFETQTDAQGIFWDETLPGAGADASSLLLRFFMALMREAEDGEFVVHNPYLRAKAAEIVFVLAEDARRWERVVCGSIDTDELAGSLAALYVQVEALGTSTAFYDKFTIRFHVARALLRMFDGSGRNSTSLRDTLRHFKTANEALLVRFLNLVVGDATYLLDEAFTKLAEIKDKETRRDELAADAQRLLAQTERQCESLLLLGAASLDLLAALAGAESVRCTLLRPELLPRLAAMLNFNLVLLAGPRCAALKVRDPGRYRFNPRALLGSLLDVYLSMGGCDVFVRAVGEDERSFSTRLLDATLSIMRRTGMAEEKIASFEAFCAAVQNAARRGLVTANGGESGEEGAEDAIPDDFLDPILFTLMTDPVLLPTSQIVIDRSTITAHLLNDPHDPFNRQPLRSEDLLPCPSELKTRLDLYLAQRRGRS
jgi:ubiquitin conjugation factor E4 B